MNIEQELELLVVLKQHLQHLESQKATLGIFTPPHIIMEIKNYQQQIETKEHEIDAEQRQRIQLFFDSHGLKLEPPPLADGLILLVSPLRHKQALPELSTYHAIKHHATTLLWRCTHTNTVEGGGCSQKWVKWWVTGLHHAAIWCRYGDSHALF